MNDICVATSIYVQQNDVPKFNIVKTRFKYVLDSYHTSTTLFITTKFGTIHNKTYISINGGLGQTIFWWKWVRLFFHKHKFTAAIKIKLEQIISNLCQSPAAGE